MNEEEKIRKIKGIKSFKKPKEHIDRAMIEATSIKNAKEIKKILIMCNNCDITDIRINKRKISFRTGNCSEVIEMLQVLEKTLKKKFK